MVIGLPSGIAHAFCLAEVPLLFLTAASPAAVCGWHLAQPRFALLCSTPATRGRRRSGVLSSSPAGRLFPIVPRIGRAIPAASTKPSGPPRHSRPAEARQHRVCRSAACSTACRPAGGSSACRDASEGSCRETPRCERREQDTNLTRGLPAEHGCVTYS